MASDNFTYEKESIEQWIEESKKRGVQALSPLTNEPLTDTLRPNKALKGAIEEIRQRYSKSAELSGKSISIREALYQSNSNSASLDISGLGRALTSDVFVALDALMHLDLMTKLNLQAPQVVVIGTENHGKSTLLERLIGFPVFPSHKFLCTRCPIRVKLRRTKGVSISLVSVRNRTNGNVDPNSVTMVALEKMSEHVSLVM